MMLGRRVFSATRRKQFAVTAPGRLTRQSTPCVPLSRLFTVSLFQPVGYSKMYLATAVQEKSQIHKGIHHMQYPHTARAKVSDVPHRGQSVCTVLSLEHLAACLTISLCVLRVAAVASVAGGWGSLAIEDLSSWCAAFCMRFGHVACMHVTVCTDCLTRRGRAETHRLLVRAVL